MHTLSMVSDSMRATDTRVFHLTFVGKFLLVLYLGPIDYPNMILAQKKKCVFVDFFFSCANNLITNI